jgi:osmotically inducible lipoprotein OsmB
MKTARLIIVFIIIAGLIGGCSSMTRQQQRVLSGGAIGAGTGAALGAIAGHGILVGAAIGAAAGAVGGYVYDQSTCQSKQKH